MRYLLTRISVQNRPKPMMFNRIGSPAARSMGCTATKTNVTHKAYRINQAYIFLSVWFIYETVFTQQCMQTYTENILKIHKLQKSITFHRLKRVNQGIRMKSQPMLFANRQKDYAKDLKPIRLWFPQHQLPPCHHVGWVWQSNFRAFSNQSMNAIETMAYHISISRAVCR